MVFALTTFMVNFKKVIFVSLLAVTLSSVSYAQQMHKVGHNTNIREGLVTGDDEHGSVFSPIEKYIKSGDVDCLSAWFADNLRISIVGRVSDCSKKQARQILKDFFRENAPRSFKIVHKSGTYPMQCAVGDFSSGGSNYTITIMVKTNDKGTFIEQIIISHR